MGAHGIGLHGAKYRASGERPQQRATPSPPSVSVSEAVRRHHRTGQAQARRGPDVQRPLAGATRSPQSAANASEILGGPRR